MNTGQFTFIIVLLGIQLVCVAYLCWNDIGREFTKHPLPIKLQALATLGQVVVGYLSVGLGFTVVLYILCLLQ
jgi:hypothetical protein